MAFQGDSIFWVEVEKVVPNPFQPRREFDQSKLQELSESIRMYGVLQPLTVTRQEVQNEDGTFFTQYELIAGERRLRASKLAGVAQVPVIIREGEESEQEKLELAIIENLQREDLNAIDRALAFQQLADQFNLSHVQVGKKVGRSREYVANSIRLLQLPEHMRACVQRGELGEGHARTLLMLSDKPEEQETIFREVLLKKMSGLELERITRKIATDKVRKPHANDIDQHLIDIEKEFTETLGTRVQIQKTEFGGKLTIDYFSDEDLESLLKRVQAERASGQLASMAPSAATATVAAATPTISTLENPTESLPTPPAAVVSQAPVPQAVPQVQAPTPPLTASVPPVTHAHSTQPLPAVTPESQNLPIAGAPDPSLIERLAAHTPLSFAKPEPEPAPAPAPEPVSTQPTAEPPVAVVPQTFVPQPTNLASDTPLDELPSSPPEVVSEPKPAPETDENESSEAEQNLYSLRNFTV